MFIIMNTVHIRLKHLRQELLGLSLREFRERVNDALPTDGSLSLGTLSNYERAGGAGPRTEFLSALKRAFPELRLEWLVLGEGAPTTVAADLAAPDGLEAKAEGARGAQTPFAARVLERYPDLELLAPEASALFMAALTRLAMGEPEMALDEAHLLELAGDLRWFLLAPVDAWGFEHDPAYRVFSDYAVGLLHALMQLMPETGEGDPIEDYNGSVLERLRTAHPVGF